MKIIGDKLIPREVKYKCDSCNIGYMNGTQIVCGGSEAYYKHKCDYCGEEILLKDCYPKVEYFKD